jgi:signal transduction histidine kinase
MKNIVTILLCIYAAHCGAQNIDSMIAEANKLPRGDTNRLNLLATANWTYQYVDIEKAEKLAVDGLAEAKQYNNTRNIYRFLVTVATIQQGKANFVKSIAFFNEALQLAKKNNRKKWEHTIYNNLGNTYNLMGDMIMAIQCYEKSIDTKKKYDPDTDWADTYLNIGAIHGRLGDYEMALKNTKLCLTDPRIRIANKLNAYSNICNYYCGLNNKDSAKRYLTLNYNLLSSEAEATASDKFSYYLSMFEYKLRYDLNKLTAEDFNKAIELAKQLNTDANIARVYYLIARINNKQNNIDTGIYYGLLGCKIHQSQNNYVDLKACYQTLAELYTKKNNLQEANKYLLLSDIITDSIYKEKNAEAIQRAEVKFATQQQKEKADLLEKKSKVDAQLKKVYLLLGLFSCIIISYYFINKRNKHEKLLKENFAKQLINTQEEERQRIAKDLHDSVGQNILFIKNQLLSKEKDDDKLLKSIDTAIEEVRNISKDLYPNQLQKYGLASAVDALSEQVKDSTGIFISSDLQGIDEALNKNVQINFYRIIQEFVNNTVKHANATAIRITTEQSAKELKLIVQDNGKGFDVAQLKTKANTSFGMLNMEERIKMLKGKVEIESEIGKGTKSVFTIPI